MKDHEIIVTALIQPKEHPKKAEMTSAGNIQGKLSIRGTNFNDQNELPSFIVSRGSVYERRLWKIWERALNILFFEGLFSKLNTKVRRTNY